MKFRFLLVISLLFLASGLNPRNAVAEFSRVTILQTGDVAGHLFACPS
jgi:hypothetical protein